MNVRLPLFTVQLVLALLLVSDATRAAQSYDNCTGFITSLPAVISTQGTWCFKQDVTTAITSGDAISIAANNVTLDCNDFKLGGLAGGIATQATGISAIDRLNVTVRHCNIRGFSQGVSLVGSGGGGHLVEDNRFDGNTYIAVSIQGDGSTIQRNRVFDTGGSTVNIVAAGIVAHNSVDVLDNTISEVFAPTGSNGNAFGINTVSSVAGRIIGNGVRGVVADGAGAPFGIYAASAVRVSVRDNDIDGSGAGIGLHCTNNTSHARGNLSVNFATGFELCNDDGGNVTAP